MKTNTLLSVVPALALILSGSPCWSRTDTLKSTLGKHLFQTNCSSCHSVHSELLGPALASITKKRDEKWLVSFIQNSQSVVSGNDPYARQLFERYHHQVMPSFRHLSIVEIKSILAYVETESRKPPDDLASGKDVDQKGSPSVFHGQLIFQTQCGSCHFLDHEGSYGPSLGSVTKRHSPRWLKSFIRNSQRVISSGDPYAVALFNKFEKREMATMEFLTGEEIQDVLQYIEFRSSSDHATAGAAGRPDQFGRKFSEIRKKLPETPLQGADILAVVVGLLVFTGAFLYAFVIRRVLRYAQNKIRDTPAGDRGN